MSGGDVRMAGAAAGMSRSAVVGDGTSPAHTAACRSLLMDGPGCVEAGACCTTVHGPVLVVDNRDSFVFNLVRYLWELGARVCVLEAETLDLDAVASLRPAGILLSPGPKTPADAVMCKRLVERFAGTLPILGVCLGHQVIAETFGGIVLPGNAPVHGKNADILHDGDGVFAGLPNPFSATRYHSLVVDASSLPGCLQVTARTPDGIVMGIRHTSCWIEGVQFHPEAALSEQGHALLANFLRACGVRVCVPDASVFPATGEAIAAGPTKDVVVSQGPHSDVPNCLPGISGALRKIIPLEGHVDAMRMFTRVQERCGSVFLDSAKRHPEAGTASMVAWSPWLSVSDQRGNEPGAAGACSRVNRYDAGGRVTETHASSRDALEEVRFRLRPGTGACVTPSGHFPSFTGGAIGMLSYEAWDPEWSLPGRTAEGAPRIPGGKACEPLSWFWFHRFVLYVDHGRDGAYLVVTMPEAVDGMDRLIEDALELVYGHSSLADEEPLKNTGVTPSACAPHTGRDHTHSPELPPPVGDFTSNFGETAYHLAIERMRAYIRTGDIYIANMTRQISTLTDLTGPELHRRLRACNPAAFSAYFPFADWELVSASPERFLRIRGGWVETRPIKGTRPRGRTTKEDADLRTELAQSAKDRAELLMITDLERNDLSRVCDPGTVAATALFELETLPTVFHLVSTVRGRLSPGRDAIDCLKACFPGGSITGAPKLRAMEVIRELEGIPRGPYTGCLGWIGCDGDADFSILIRTFVKRGREVCFGVGGGITWDSDPEAEWRETRDKARALVEALGGGRTAP